MADERVTHTHPDDLTQDIRTQPNCRRAFRLEDMDRVTTLAIRAMSLLGVLSSAAMADDPPSGQETSNACWVVKGMVEEMKGIVEAVWNGERATAFGQVGATE